jgi:site-specific recombinase XerD
MPLVITDPIIRQFAAEQRSSNRWAQSNIDNAVRVLHRVSRWLAARDVALLDATRADLAEYIADRRDNGRNHRGEPLSPNTLIVEHRQLKAYFAWAATDHGDGDPYITGNPMKNSKTPAGVDAEVSSTPSISEAQYRALLAACVAKRTAQGRPDGRSPTARRDVAILTLLWSTGARRGEIASIRYGDLDWGTQTVHLQKRGRRARPSPATATSTTPPSPPSTGTSTSAATTPVPCSRRPGSSPAPTSGRRSRPTRSPTCSGGDAPRPASTPSWPASTASASTPSGAARR